MKLPRITICRCLAGLTSAAMLLGCPGQPLEPQIVIFNYAVRQVADPAALIASIQGGQTTVVAEIGANPCNFTASFAGPNPPSININGDPGQTGFNISIVSTTPTNLATTNPGNCQAIEEIMIFIGARNQALNVGGRTNLTSAELMVGGMRLGTASGFFEASLTAFRQQTRYASGEFRFVGTMGSTAGPATVLLADGSYAGN
jgi:hypothetical protein